MRNPNNSVHLIGNLGRDPEIKKFDSGSALATMTLATNSVYKNKDGEKAQKTQWHKLVAWGAQTETIEKYLKKGSEIAVVGTLEYRSYEAKNGEMKTVTEIKIDSFKMLGRPSAQA